jgi:hypothetical protein
MLPSWLERLSVLGLLLLAVALRTYDLAHIPLGFSNEELVTIHMVEQVRDGRVQVFFGSPPAGGQESLYAMMNTVSTSLTGDGLLGYRALGLWGSLLGLAFFYSAVRGLFGPSVALVTLSILVTSLWGVLLSRSVLPVTLSPLMMGSALWVMVRTFRLHRPIAPKMPSTGWYTILGFLLAAGIYLHYLGLLLVLALIFFVVYLWRTRQPVARRVWDSSIFALGLVLVLGLPYIISLARTPTDSGLSVFWRERPTDLLDFGNSALMMLGGFFFEGDSDPTHNMPGLPLVWPVWFLLALGGLWMSLRRWREPAYGLILILLPLSLVPDLWLQGGPTFEALTLAHLVLCVLAGLGSYAIGRYIHSNLWDWRFVMFLVGLGLLFTLWQTYNQLLRQWPEREDVEAAYHSDVARIALYLDSELADTPTLFCVENLRTVLLSNGIVRWGEPEILRRMRGTPDENLRYAACRTSFVLINGGELMRIIMMNTRAVEEAVPPVRTWLEAREIIPAEGLPEGTVAQLESVAPLARLGGQLQMISPLYYPRAGADSEVVSLPVRFGRNITLLGYLPPQENPYHPGDVLPLTTYWRIDGEPPDHLGIFTRLHDSPQSSPYTEANALAVLPETLRRRDILIQTNFITIPENLLPGEYILTLGAYDNNPLNQIEVFTDEARIPRGNYLTQIPRLVVAE